MGSGLRPPGLAARHPEKACGGALLLQVTAPDGFGQPFIGRTAEHEAVFGGPGVERGALRIGELHDLGRKAEF